MFYLDIFGNLQPLSIYLSKPDGSLITPIDNMIDETSSSLEIGLNKQYTLSFSITKSGNNVWFDHILEGMYLFVEKIGLFKINQPQIEMDGLTEKKTITAHSVDSELEDKEGHYEINMGTKTSLERQVIYEDGETEVLINPYTNIPYDWILLYNTLPEQLTTFKNKVISGYFGNPDGNDEIVITDSDLIDELTEMFTLVQRLKCKIVFTNNQDGSQDSSLIEYVIAERDENDNSLITQYTLTSLFASRIDELITYYTKYGDQLSLLDIICKETNNSWSVGDIYGLDNGDYSLANKKWQFEIDENLYAFLTQTFAKTSECVVSFNNIGRKINVTPVDQIGNDTGITIGYDNLVNTLNIDTQDDRLTTRIYVSGGNEMNLRKVNFGSDYVDDITYKLNAKDSSGKRIYVSDELAEKYMDYIEDRETARERFRELSVLYDAYITQINEIKNRVPLDSLKVDYSTFSMEELQGELTAYKNLLATLKSLYKEEFTPIGLNNDGSIKETFIRDTAYWYEYKAYQDTITEIEFAIRVFPDYNDHTKWSSGDLDYYKNTVNAWETEWSLYGTIELQAKIDAYKNNMNQLAQKGVIRVSTDDYPIKTWSQLTDSEKSEYLTQDHYYYDTYMENYNHMLDAQDYLEDLNDQIEDIEQLIDDVITERDQITLDIQLENNFTPNECKIINRLYRDSTYSNENILTTKIDSVSEKIDRQMELLNDAKDQISILSRPQLQFTVDADNLLAIKEFKPLWSQFIPGNYIYVQYRDKTYVKLRMIGFTFNPSLPSSGELSIEFSNFVRSRSYYHDWASLLGNDTGGSGGSGGSSNGGGSGDGYGESDDIDVAISNTMLAQLLNSETFGTRVSDVILDTIDINAITARSATFGGLANGTTKIDGQCIQTGWIVSDNYNGNRNTGTISNTQGSILRIADGTFNFAGGKLTYGPNNQGNYVLSVDGTITANDGTIGGFQIDSTSIHTVGKLVESSDTTSVALSSADFTRTVANASRTGLRFAIGSKFGVKNDGTLYANDGVFIGDITANNGEIGGWSITSDRIYKEYTAQQSVDGKRSVVSINSVFYDGTQTIPYNPVFRVNYNNEDQFYVRSNGELFARNAKITGEITAQSGTIAGPLVILAGPNHSGGYFTTNPARTYYNDGVNSGITIDAEGIGGYGLDTNNVPGYFNMTNDGRLSAINANISGTITATAGNIGGWTIEQNWLYNGTNHPAQNSVFLMPAGTQSAYPVAGHTINGWVFTSHDTFGVTKSGGVYATAGEIGGWTLSGTSLSSSATIDNATRITGLQVPSNGSIAITVGATSSNDWSTAPFYVTHKGVLHATAGAIGGWDITSTTLSKTTTINNVSRTTGFQANNSSTHGAISIAVGATSSSWITAPFFVTHNGILYASGAVINGTLTAGANSVIGPWTVSDTAIYKVNATMGNATAGAAYFGDNGLSITNKFQVSPIGNVTIDNGTSCVTMDGSIMIGTSSTNIITTIATSNILSSAPIISSKSSTSGNTESAIMAQNLTSTGEVRVYVGNYYRSGSLVASSGQNLGIYDHGGNSWVLRSANTGNVYIPHPLYVTSISGTGDCPVIGTGTVNNKVGRIYSSTDTNGRVKFNMNSGNNSTFTDIYYVDCNSSSSDIRLKTNITNTSVTNARQLIDTIKIREFDWTDGRKTPHQKIGFVADELEALDPHFAIGGGYEEDGSMCIKSVDTFYLLAYLTKALQELSEEVKQLRAENNQLKNKIL